MTSHLDTSFCLFRCNHLFREDLDFCDRGSPLVIRSYHTNPKGISIDFIKVKVIHFPSFELIWCFEVGHWFPVGSIVEDMLLAFDKARIFRRGRHGLASIILDHVGFRSPNAVIFVEGYVQIVYCPLSHNTRISKENAHWSLILTVPVCPTIGWLVIVRNHLIIDIRYWVTWIGVRSKGQWQFWTCPLVRNIGSIFGLSRYTDMEFGWQLTAFYLTSDREDTFFLILTWRNSIPSDFCWGNLPIWMVSPDTLWQVWCFRKWGCHADFLYCDNAFHRHLSTRFLLNTFNFSDYFKSMVAFKFFFFDSLPSNLMNFRESFVVLNRNSSWQFWFLMQVCYHMDWADCLNHFLLRIGLNR